MYMFTDESMYMYVSVYALYMYICTYVYMYICTHHIYMHVYIHICWDQSIQEILPSLRTFTNEAKRTLDLPGRWSR